MPTFVTESGRPAYNDLRSVKSLHTREKCMLSLLPCPSVLAAPTGQISVKFGIGDFLWKFVEGLQIWSKLFKNTGHFTWSPKFISLLLETLNRHENVLLDGNDIRFLGELRRYKHCANAPQCYVIYTFPILF